MSALGYSKTPLSKKLGIKVEFLIQVYNSPKDYLEFFHEFPEEVVISDSNQEKESVNFIHIIASSVEELTTAFSKAKPTLKKNGILWISWPKKSSKIPVLYMKSSGFLCTNFSDYKRPLNHLFSFD